MDTNSIIIVSVFCGTSSLCLCCILIKVFNEIRKELSRERIRQIAIKTRGRFKYNSIVSPEEENLRQGEIV